VTAEERLDVGAASNRYRLEVGNCLAAADNRVTLAAVLYTVE
jgi:hypothetical protein